MCRLIHRTRRHRCSVYTIHYIWENAIPPPTLKHTYRMFTSRHNMLPYIHITVYIPNSFKLKMQNISQIFSMISTYTQDNHNQSSSSRQQNLQHINLITSIYEYVKSICFGGSIYKSQGNA